MESFRKEDNELVVDKEGFLMNYLDLIKSELDKDFNATGLNNLESGEKTKIELLDYVAGQVFLEKNGFSGSAESLKSNDKVLIFDFPHSVSVAWDAKSEQANKFRSIYESLHEALNQNLFSVNAREIFRKQGVSITRLNKHGQHIPGDYYYVARVRFSD